MRTWQDLEGWFDYEQLYSQMAEKYRNGVFVEVGCWLGKSAAYLASQCRDKNSQNQIYCVDNWDGLDLEYMAKTKERHNKNSIFEIFQQGISDCQLGDLIIPIISCSWEAASKFDDGSCDFIFIDADHSYESVVKDIIAWYPKLKISGTLAGHDIASEDIQRACSDSLSQFGKSWNRYGSCWIMV